LNFFLHNVNKPEGRRPLPGRRLPASLEFYDTSSLFVHRLEVLGDPDKNLGKSKFRPGYRAIDKSVSTAPWLRTPYRPPNNSISLCCVR
jgi:hypothetical protein